MSDGQPGTRAALSPSPAVARLRARSGLAPLHPSGWGGKDGGRPAGEGEAPLSAHPFSQGAAIAVPFRSSLPEPPVPGVSPVLGWKSPRCHGPAAPGCPGAWLPSAPPAAASGARDALGSVS